MIQFGLVGVAGAVVAVIGGVESTVFAANSDAVTISDFSGAAGTWTIFLDVTVPAMLALSVATWKRGRAA